MKLEYDVEADAAYIRFSETPRSRTEEISDVCMVDFDPAPGNVVAIELLTVFGFAAPPSMRLSGRACWLSKTPSDYCRNSVTNWSRRSVPDGYKLRASVA